MSRLESWHFADEVISDDKSTTFKCWVLGMSGKSIFTINTRPNACYTGDGNVGYFCIIPVIYTYYQPNKDSLPRWQVL